MTGDLDDYRRELLQGEAKAKRQVQARRRSENRGQRRSAAAAREKLKPLRAQAAKQEKEIERLKGVLEKIDAGLAVDGLWEKDPALAADLTRKRARCVDHDRRPPRWPGWKRKRRWRRRRRRRRTGFDLTAKQGLFLPRGEI
jgi:hypothetical protein